MRAILSLLQSSRWRDAEIQCRKALSQSPRNPQLLQFLGTALLMGGRPDAALQPLNLALKHDPGSVVAANTKGLALEGVGRLKEAVDTYRRALVASPSGALAFNLGNAYRRLGELEGALEAYRKACIHEPNDLRALSALVRMKQRLCEWDGLDALSGRLIETAERADQALDPFRFLTLATDEPQQLANARRWARRFPATRQLAGTAVAKDRITLGYVSADFQDHPTAYLMAELFELHDRDRFSVLAYSLAPDDGSAMRRRLVGGIDRFADCAGMEANAVARQIAADRVDVLVDLKGYTRHAVPRILAARPAPVQVQWIGYPGTMGARFIDYVLADATVLPEASQPFWDECGVRLPGCYQVNDRRRPRPATAPSRADFGLPAQAPVAAAFNNAYKITRPVFAIWMRLLRHVDAAVLWILSDDPVAQSYLRAAAERHGVSGNRLVFARRLPLAQHLARYRHVDVFLDTLPVNAHTTASDALWMGCPVVTRIGDTFAGRVAASLLKAVRLERYIAATDDAYERIALRLLRDPEERAAVRRHLNADPAALPLFDAPCLTAAVESAYEIMWARAVDGLAPRPFAVPGDSPRAQRTAGLAPRQAEATAGRTVSADAD